MVETIAPLKGWSGDTNDSLPTVSSTTLAAVDEAITVEAVGRATGKDLKAASRDERLAAIAEIFGIKRGSKRAR
jgi:hypothetical protein